MVRRMTPSQFNNMVRQRQNQMRQAVNKYNQEVNRINREIDAANRRAVDDYNRKVREYNQKARQEQMRLESEARLRDQRRRQAVNKINTEIRTYNNRVRANQQRIKTAVAQLNAQPTIRYTQTRSSAVSLNTAYEQLVRTAETESLGGQYNEVLDYSERETANSLDIYNALEAEDDQEVEADENETNFIDTLKKFSDDFSARWQGAVFSLSPKNPDASRHFCTSVREIFIGMIDLCAPNERVLNAVPDCPIYQGNTPTRRAKIEFMLARRGLPEPALGEFVAQDIDDILNLLAELNGATHGNAGKFTLGQLSKLRKRVRDGLEFLAMLGKPA